MTTTEIPSTYDYDWCVAMAERERSLETIVSELNQRVARLVSDRDYVAASLQDEAMRRDWCSEYDDFCDMVNAHVSEPWLRPCRFTRVATIQVIVRYTSRRGDNALEEIRSALGDLGPCNVDIEDVGVVVLDNQDEE